MLRDEENSLYLKPKDWESLTLTLALTLASMPRLISSLINKPLADWGGGKKKKKKLKIMYM